MARRRMTVEDDVEILVHWRAGRGIRQIARSLGRSRITVRDRIAQAVAAGFGRAGPAWTAAEWRAAQAAGDLADPSACPPVHQDLGIVLHGHPPASHAFHLLAEEGGRARNSGRCRVGHIRVAVGHIRDAGWVISVTLTWRGGSVS